MLDVHIFGISTLLEGQGSSYGMFGGAFDLHVRVRRLPRNIRARAQRVFGCLHRDGSLAITQVGRVFAWGNNVAARLGFQNSQEIIRKPTLHDYFIKQKAKIVQIKGGTAFLCFLASDGRVFGTDKLQFDHLNPEKTTFEIINLLYDPKNDYSKLEKTNGKNCVPTVLFSGFNHVFAMDKGTKEVRVFGKFSSERVRDREGKDEEYVISRDIVEKWQGKEGVDFVFAGGADCVILRKL